MSEGNIEKETDELEDLIQNCSAWIGKYEAMVSDIGTLSNAKQIDSLPILQNFDFYAPNTIAVELNEKSNKTFKLGSLCRMNGFDLGDKAHTAEADTLGMSKLMQLISKKNPELFQKCISLNDKKNVSETHKMVCYETFNFKRY